MSPSIRVGVGGWTYEPWRDNFYPAGWPQARELEYASRQLTRDRGQRHLLQLAEAGHLRQVARRDAGRLRVLAQGHALRHQPARAGRGRRVGAALRRQRHRRAGAQARAHRLAVRADQAVRPGRLRGLPEAAAGAGGRRAAAPCARRAPRQLQVAPSTWRWRAATGVATVFTDSDDYPSFADVTGDFVYCAHDAHRRQLPEGCTPQALAQLAACAQRVARRRRAGGPAARRAGARRPTRRATCSCSSSAAPRRRRRRRRWRCCGTSPRRREY